MALERDDALILRYLFIKAGAPTTGDVAPKGALCLDTATPDLYMNTDGDDTWEKVGLQS